MGNMRGIFLVRTCLLIMVAAHVLAAQLPCAAAQGKRSNQAADERRENKQVQNAKEDVDAAEKKLRSDQGLLAKAQAERSKIVGELKKLKQATEEVREKLEAQFGKALGWPEAHGEHQAAQAAYDKAAEPVIAKLKTSPDYSATAEKLATTQAELESLSNEESRRSMRLKIADIQRQLSDLQSRELLAVPAVKQAQQSLLAAQQRLQDIRTKIDPQVDASEAWKEAQKNWQETRLRLEQSEARIMDMQRKLASDQAKLASERSDLAKAKQRDQQDPNNAKRKNKSKK
jgi:chromosome segregation ATPase